jgi:hypothetical protein
VTEHEETAAAVTDELGGALTAFAQHLEVMESDPGAALAHLTWLGLSLANRCQVLSGNVVPAQEGITEEYRFLSLPGALFNSFGKLVTLERPAFEQVLYGGYKDDWGPA